MEAIRIATNGVFTQRLPITASYVDVLPVLAEDAPDGCLGLWYRLDEELAKHDGCAGYTVCLDLDKGEPGSQITEEVRLGRVWLWSWYWDHMRREAEKEAPDTKKLAAIWDSEKKAIAREKRDERNESRADWAIQARLVAHRRVQAIALLGVECPCYIDSFPPVSRHHSVWILKLIPGRNCILPGQVSDRG